MLIVVTQDNAIRAWAEDGESGSGQWAPVLLLDKGDPPVASEQLLKLLGSLDINEPLCLFGHGNDKEVGDEGSGPGEWSWSHVELAALLGLGLPQGYEGPILMQVCADTPSDFAAHLAVSLEADGKVHNVWVYGYNKHIDIIRSLPAPDKLDKSVELFAKHVR